MLIVTFVESESGSEGCRGETNGPNAPSNGGTVAVGSFGSDIFTRPDSDRGTGLSVSPRSAPAGAKTSFKFRLKAGLSQCTQGSTIAFAGHRAVTNKKGIVRLRVRLHGRKATAMATSAIRKPAKASVRVRASG